MGSEQECASPMTGMVDGEGERMRYSSEDHARYLYAKYLFPDFGRVLICLGCFLNTPNVNTLEHVIV